MKEKFKQISNKPGFMKHNGGIFFRKISNKEFEFKTRKLGNYRANGLYLHDNELLVEQKGYHNTEYNIVSLDVNSPSSMIYELTNLVGLSNEEFIKSPVRRAIALHFKSKVNSNICIPKKRQF